MSIGTLCCIILGLCLNTTMANVVKNSKQPLLLPINIVYIGKREPF